MPNISLKDALEYIQGDDDLMKKIMFLYKKVGKDNPLFLELAQEVVTRAEQDGRTDTGGFSHFLVVIREQENKRKENTPP